MKNAGRWVGAVLGCLVVVGMVAQASAQDWPQWLGAARDGKVTGFTPPAAWPKELKQVWKVSVGAGDGGPALVGDRVYVFTRQGGDEVTLCLNAKDGNEIWRDKYATAAITGSDSRAHPGPRATPTVADGKVITLGVNGVLSCLDAKDGNVVWRKQDIKGTPQFHTASSPIVVDGLVIAQLGGADGAVYAFDLAKGDEKWKRDGAAPGYASPVLLTVDGVKQVVTLTDKAVVGVAVADGKLLWQVPFPVAGRMGYNAATPIVDGTTVIYTGQGRGTHAIKVEKKGDAFTATETSKGDVGAVFNTPVLKDGMVYGLSDKGKLFALNAKDLSKTVWEDGGGHQNWAAILDAGSVLMALPNNGELIVYKPGEKFEEVAKFKVGAGTYGEPVVCGKKILVKDQDSLTMWSLE